MRNKTSILIIILTSLLSLPAISLAVTVEGMAENVKNISLKVGIAAVVVFWVATGVLFLSAQGSPEKVSTAKKALFMAIAGTVIIIIAATAISFVSSALGI